MEKISKGNSSTREKNIEIHLESIIISEKIKGDLDGYHQKYRVILCKKDNKEDLTPDLLV